MFNQQQSTAKNKGVWFFVKKKYNLFAKMCTTKKNQKNYKIQTYYKYAKST